MTEIQHYTPEQLVVALKNGKTVVAEAELPESLQNEAILWAAQKLCEKTIMQGAPALLPMQGRIQ